MLAYFAAIRIALRAIQKNVLRATLTVLGILIGVAAVVTVTALGSGARESVGKQIESLGSNFIIVFPDSSSSSGARGAQGTGARLTEDDGRARAELVVGDKNTSTSVIGSNRDFFTVRNWKLQKGTLWDEHDEVLKTKVCVLGTTVKTKLFGDQDPIGKTLRIGRYNYKILGVLESKGQAPIGGDQDDQIVMPIGSMRARVFRTPAGFAGALMISATSSDTTDRAVNQITGILRQRHRIDEGKNPDFAIRTQQEFLALQQGIYGVLTALLVAVAAVSLVVGGIGIMNIMLVSVTERTREIGIRMAIGAREHDIRSQFLVEAIALSVIGGLLGLAVGGGATYGLGKVLEWNMSLSPAAVAASIGTSAATGIIFGFFPARRASRMDPIDALRRE